MATPKYLKFRVKQVYMKPLLPKGFSGILDLEHALRVLQRGILQKIRAAIKTQDAFSERARRALSKALQAKIQKSSVLVTSNHPAFAPLVLGMKAQPMTWLTKAKSPIPIITEKGDLIFRWATPRSLANGKWIHPGHPKTDLLEKARVAARDYVKERIAEEFAREIRKTFKRSAA